jgi:hypothetical protein
VRAIARVSSLIFISIIETPFILDSHVARSLAQGDDIVVYTVSWDKNQRFRKETDRTDCSQHSNNSDPPFQHRLVLPAIQSYVGNTNTLTYPIFQLQNACYELFVKADCNKENTYMEDKKRFSWASLIPHITTVP